MIDELSCIYFHNQNHPQTRNHKQQLGSSSETSTFLTKDYAAHGVYHSFYVNLYSDDKMEFGCFGPLNQIPSPLINKFSNFLKTSISPEFLEI